MRFRGVAAAAASAALLLAGCSDDGSTSSARPAPSAAVPDVALPPGPLADLVLQPDEIPNGLVPLVTGSGPRGLETVAGYSPDPTAAAAALRERGFRNAYVGQYADPSDGRLLSVVVTRFGDAAGAQADVTDDLESSAGEPVEAPTVGEQSELRRQPLPGSQEGELLTLRFRQGPLTYLVAYGDPDEADPDVVVELAQLLAERGSVADA